MSLLSQSWAVQKTLPLHAHRGKNRLSESEGHSAATPSVPRSPPFQAHLSNRSQSHVGGVQAPIDLAAFYRDPSHIGLRTSWLQHLCPLRRNMKSSRCPPPVSRGPLCLCSCTAGVAHHKCTIPCASPPMSPLCLSYCTSKMGMMLGPMVPASRGCRDKHINECM